MHPRARLSRLRTPLVIIGTRVETNWEGVSFCDDQCAGKTKSCATPQTNPVAPATVPSKIEPAVTNTRNHRHARRCPKLICRHPNVAPQFPMSLPLPRRIPSLQTNAIASSENLDSTRNGTMALAAGFLIGAIALTVWFIFRSRHSDRSSLITRTMNKK